MAINTLDYFDRTRLDDPGVRFLCRNGLPIRVMKSGSRSLAYDPEAGVWTDPEDVAIYMVEK